MVTKTSTSPSNSISAQLNNLRSIQSIGQLLVALGGFIAFISLREQIPLYALQTSIMQGMQQKMKQMEKKTCNKDPDDYTL